MMWKYFCYAVGFIFGTIMLFGGAFVLHSMPSLFADKIKSNLPIVNGTDAYTRYTTPSVPLDVKMYLFNVTNPEEVANNGAKPQLSQVGPIVLTERRKKQVVAISKDTTTLDYKLWRTYYFNESETKVDMESYLTLPNAPVFSAFFAALEKKYDEEGAGDPVSVVTDYAANESLYLTHKVKDWLFNGVDLNWLKNMDADGVPLDDPPPDFKFGFYYKKNNTWDEKADGVMTISTGVDGNFTNIGKVVQWNKKREVSFWRGSKCNTIQGTDGQFFHPFVQKDEKLDIFAPDLCRTLTIEFVKTTQIRSIDLYRFGISSSFFQPINTDEGTKCYCVKRDREQKQKFCKLSGVVDVSSCRKKPIVLSTPHFYGGDAMLRQAVDGLSPSATLHDTFIDIEPMTGAVLRVRRRLQLNIEMNPTKGYTASMALKEGIIHPFVWLDQSIVVPDELAQKLENKLTKIVRMVRILCYAALITGPIILLSTLIFICRDIRTEDQKIRQAKSSNNNRAPYQADYQKVPMSLKPLGNSIGASGDGTGVAGDV